MTKADLVNRVVKETGVERGIVLEVLEAFTEGVKGTLGKGENVYIRGFGSFVIKTRAAKVARNISKNTTINIPAHNIAAFKPARELAESVRDCK